MGIASNHLGSNMKGFKEFLIVVGAALIFALLVIWWYEFMQIHL